MNQEDVRKKLLEIIQKIVDAIAQDRYEVLEGLIALSPSWYKEEGDTKGAIQQFREMIEINYQGWAEDTGKEYRIAAFDRDELEEDLDQCAEELLTCGETQLTYCLKTEEDDPDYFWLELEFQLNPEQQLTGTMDLNF